FGDTKDAKDAKDTMLAEALVTLSQKPLSKGGPPAEFDPKLFTRLATNVDAKVWNDKTATTGARKGLGARVCMELWNLGGYDQICELIEHGVDTSLPTRIGAGMTGTTGEKDGYHSGFVEPNQHVISKYLRDVELFDKTDTSSWDANRKKKAEGAKKIFVAL